jgi:hypothetical protein
MKHALICLRELLVTFARWNLATGGSYTCSLCRLGCARSARVSWKIIYIPPIIGLSGQYCSYFGAKQNRESAM